MQQRAAGPARSFSSTTIVAPPVIVGGGFGYSPFGYGGGFGMPFMPMPFFGGGIFQIFFLLTLASVVANVVRGIAAGAAASANKGKGGEGKSSGGGKADDSWDEL